MNRHSYIKTQIDVELEIKNLERLKKISQKVNKETDITITDFMLKHKPKYLDFYLEQSSLLIKKSHYGHNIDFVQKALSKMQYNLMKIETDEHIVYINFYGQCSDSFCSKYSIDCKFENISYDTTEYINGISTRTFKECDFHLSDAEITSTTNLTREMLEENIGQRSTNRVKVPRFLILV